MLSRKTGFLRNYGTNGDPYGSYIAANRGYYGSDQPVFRPIVEDRQLPPKAVVVGIRDDTDNAAAIREDRLRREKSVDVSLGGRTIRVSYDAALDAHAAGVRDTGEWINAFDAMWFAWKAFYPGTALLR